MTPISIVHFFNYTFLCFHPSHSTGMVSPLNLTTELYQSLPPQLEVHNGNQTLLNQGNPAASEQMSQTGAPRDTV